MNSLTMTLGRGESLRRTRTGGRGGSGALEPGAESGAADRLPSGFLGITSSMEPPRGEGAALPGVRRAAGGGWA